MLATSGRITIAIILFFAISVAEFSEAHRSCAPRTYRTDAHIVCVCNATFCDDFPQIDAIVNGDTAVIITSSRSGSRFQSSTSDFSESFDHLVSNHHGEEFEAQLTVDPSALRQTIFGFGGAFTDAAGENLQRLSAPARRNLLESYYGKTGIEYTLGRVPMASCDFSSRVYSYCDVEGDFELANFNLTEEDHQLKIPFILAAQNLTNGVLRLVGSPWSSPAWMKTTNRMAGGGTLRGRFNGRYYETWAHYFRRFIEEYKREGVPIWAVTTQNEPFTGSFKSFPWQTLYFSALMQRDFIAKLLGPTLRASPSTKNVKLIIHDDQRFFLPYHADVVLQDKTASRYVDGVGVHWYGDAFSSAHRLTQTHNNFPDKFILATEACTGSVPKMQGPILGAWERAELYASSILDDVNNWASGWLDWNICLDEQGGPNWAGNVVDAPIIVNSSGETDEFYKQPMYYAMGHFSKFVRPGSVRIGFTLKISADDSAVFQYDDVSSAVADDDSDESSGSAGQSSPRPPPNLRAAAFLNPSKARVVVVLLNRDAWRTFNVNLVKGGDNRPLKKALRLKIAPNTITTVLFQHGGDGSGDHHKRRTRKRSKTVDRAE